MTAPQYGSTISAYASGGPFAPGRPDFVVIHSTEGPMSSGNAKALAQWFAKSPANGGPGTSATGIFDPIASVRMLGENTIPYHCGSGGNPVSNGDEHCGSVNLTTAQWMSTAGQAMLNRSARVQAQRAKYRGWSLAECRWLTLTQVAARNVHGFCTHNDVRLALGGTTHTDPGPNFPYTWYMGRIRAWYQDPINGGEVEDVGNTELEIKTWVNDCLENKLGLKAGEDMSLAVYGQTSNKEFMNRVTATNNPASIASAVGRIETALLAQNDLLTAMAANLGDDEADIKAAVAASTAEIKSALAEIAAQPTNPPPVA